MEQTARETFDKRYANRTLLIFALLGMTVLYVEAMLTPALPAITKQYSITSAQASLILSLYLVSGTALTPVFGKLGDIYGKKRMLSFILPTYAVMVSVTGFSPNFPFLLASRTIQGIGAGIFPLAFSLVREEFPREMVPRAQGLIAAAFGIGAAFGIPIGAYISNNYGWQTTYHTAVPFVVLLTIAALVVVKESRYRRPEAKLDYVGATVLGLALAMLVLALSEGANWGWEAGPTLGLVAAGLALLAALPFFERKVSEPILDMRLLTRRNVLVANVVMVFAGMGQFLNSQALTFELQLPPPSGYGFDILTTGLYQVPTGLMFLIIALPVSSMISRSGVKPFLILGSVVGAAGFLLLATASSSIELLYYSATMAAGLTMLFVSSQNLLVFSVQPRMMGLATSMNSVFRTVGSSVGAPVAGSIISTFTTWVFEGYYKGAPVLFSEASRTAFEYSFLLAVGCFLAVLFLVPFSREVLGSRAVVEPDAQPSGLH